MHKGQPDPELFLKTVGHVVARASAAAEGKNPRVAAFGEMVALLWAEGNPDSAVKLEQLWNDLARTHSFSLRCAYPITGFCDETHAEPFLKICSEHSTVIPGENYTTLRTEQDRLRNIAQLQQKAEALETEKALLQALRQTKEELEKEVAERREAQRSYVIRSSPFASFPAICFAPRTKSVVGWEGNCMTASGNISPF